LEEVEVDLLVNLAERKLQIQQHHLLQLHLPLQLVKLKNKKKTLVSNKTLEWKRNHLNSIQSMKQKMRKHKT
jgi:hypothetical protein